MLAEYWSRVRAWCEDTVRSSAIKGLSESIEGRIVRNAAPAILAYIVVAAVLSGQLLLQQWPESFAAFLLGSPALAVAMLSLLAIASRPSLATRVPLYACGGFALLASLQCIMGAAAMCLPSPPSRPAFALFTTVVVLCLCFGLSKTFVRQSVKTMQKAKAKVVQHVADLPEEDEDESAAFSDAED